MQLEAEARREAARLLAVQLPRRWAHVCAVAERACDLEESHQHIELLTVAAWVHDVGYSPTIATTGFHPLDGARYLRKQGWPEPIPGLVAHHSAAASEAEVFGVSAGLGEFEDERTVARDLLWYLDMTTGPDGTRLSFEDRMAEVRSRYPTDHYVIRALDLGMPERVAAVERAAAWLSSAGLDHV